MAIKYENAAKMLEYFVFEQLYILFVFVAILNGWT